MKNVALGIGAGILVSIVSVVCDTPLWGTAWIVLISYVVGILSAFLNFPAHLRR